MKLKKLITMGLIACTVAMFMACGSKDDAASTNANESLKVGLMPAVDTAPILIAEKEGYFKELGLDVDVEIYTNAKDRQSALQSNSIDGAMTDFIALATNVNGGFKIKATTMTDGMFPVLENKDFKGKKDIKVGMMEVSVSNYLIDKWLSKDYNIEKVFIDEIPARLSAVASGELDMGLFPEPIASNGEVQGLKKVVYGLDDKYSPNCMVFTEKALEEKGDAIKNFHVAYNKAVDKINSNPEIAREILVEKIPNIKPEAKELIVLPKYKKASLPDSEYVNEIITWTEDTLKKQIDVQPENLLDRQFTK
ncbi:ABC transporter substrate-binding protein [Clostridium sardiniense]|uniref:ABC transporter substrate-binding protein n=1 Tax=Clostridium sardiniense TaxID=29369 RepID=UPI003D343B55